jgi:uncharacterized protein (TIGR00730 family)
MTRPSKEEAAKLVGIVTGRRHLRAVCCFCGARDGLDPRFRAGAQALAKAMAARGLELVYGGGALGMMGTLADAMLDAGAKVTGVIPHGLARREFEHARVTTLHRVDTMHERKALMERLSDAFIALPGGFGTLDELFEIATWAQLGLHEKPIGLLDTAGYWEGLKMQVARAMREGFVGNGLEKLLVIESEPEVLLKNLLAHVPPPAAIKWGAK